MENYYDLASIYYDCQPHTQDSGLDTVFEPTIENTSFYTEEDGITYFYCGDTRIKVSEHFNIDGKPIEKLIENVVRHKAQNNR